MQTFLFTDIEGSTRLWESYPEEMRQALKSHDSLLYQRIHTHRGRVFKTMGDAFCAVFPDAFSATAAGVALQLALQEVPLFPLSEVAFRVRMALHSGPAEERDNDFFGPTLNRVARLLAVAHGGQILLSETVANKLSEKLPESYTLKDLGVHTLKDLEQPVAIRQLCHSRLPENFPALRAELRLICSLPTVSSSLVGRQSSLAKILEDFPQTRLLTLTGPSGIEKTAVAMEAAHRLAKTRAFALVLALNLAEETDSLQLWPRLAQRLEHLGIVLPRPLPGSGAEALPERVLEALASRTTLLVLSGLDQFDESTLQAPVKKLLEGAPSLKLLATAHHGLQLRGELSLALAPLSLAESVQLFLDSADLSYPDDEVSPEHLSLVMALCLRLAGLPLALELAAARTHSLSLQELLESLESHLSQQGTPKAAATRTASLGTILEWSYGLLSANAQRFLRQAALFRGSWSLETAKGSCEGDVPDAIEELCGAALLLSQEAESSETRYYLPDPIRAFARTLLTERERTMQSQRLAAWYQVLTESGSPRLQDPAERESLLYMFSFLTETQQTEPLATLLESQLALWQSRTDFDEAREQLKRYLTLCQQKDEKGLRPLTLLAHLVQGELAQHRLTAATWWLEQAGEFLDATEQEFHLTWQLVRAQWAEKRGHFEEALALQQRCEAHLAASKSVQAQALLGQIRLHLRVGRSAQAQALCQRALPELERLPMLHALSAAAFTDLGQLTRAREALDRGLELLALEERGDVANQVRPVEAQWQLASGLYERAWETANRCLLPLWEQRELGGVLMCLDIMARASWVPDRRHLTENYLTLVLAVEELLPCHRTPYERRGTVRLLQRLSPSPKTPQTIGELEQALIALPR